MRKHTPPMGWNSWNTFAKEVDEKVVMEMPEIDLPVMKYDTNNNIFLAA